MDFLRDPFGFVIQEYTGWLGGLGLPAGWVDIIAKLTGALVLATGAMLFVVFLIWYERKLIGRIQDRFGPNRVGPWGIFQPVADMLKIFTKEYITPIGADKFAYNLAPILAVAAVLLLWSVLPLSVTVVGTDLNVGLLFLVAVGGLGEMSYILAGWGSNNKYALLGAFRLVAQLISYEVPLVLSALVPVMLAGTLSVNGIVQAQESVWFIVAAPAAALIFFIASIAEIGRSPFDLIEAESELVAGYNIEYSGLKFGMFFVAEFLHAFTVSMIFATVFLGGWQGPGAAEIPVLGFVYLMLKTFVVYFVTILFRGTLPRFRIDQMMNLNWKVLTPLSLALIMAMAIVGGLTRELPVFWQVIAFLLVNLLLLGATDQLMRLSQSRKTKSNLPMQPLRKVLTTSTKHGAGE
ncbi:NADH dehydrogenase subunit H [Bellilinea caldifistulae]|uniref:NADH-quinone oxidoreductase subunit NuoH n=1 Tax=Bellilinea caldifistulae TaxID=360411 RepID=UPI0007803B24|nr:NADH-quinone oxidoreductase subunit NuoH [Bellilinea caldifistulae]GAP10373.1 NADH dehydrogenase subunit H [Bellilinea caldifistulae]